MNNVIKRIKIDLYSPTSYEVIKAQQGDNHSRVIEFELYNQEEPYSISNDISIRMEGHRGDNSSFQPKDCTVTGNIISVILDSDVLYEAGIAEAKIVMHNTSDNSILSTIPFKIHVQKNPCDKNKIESEKSSVIDWLVSNCENLKDSFNEHLKDFLNPHKVTKSQVGLGNADNTSDVDKPVSTAQQAALDKKANIESPTLTGMPKAPTASAGTNTTQIATTAFTQTAISNHNTSNLAHSDIRDLISDVSTRLNTLADSDDTTLDQLSEIVSYIKSNRSLIENITTNKINVSDIIDTLTSTATNKPLSAKQGKVLKDLIDTLTDIVSNKVDKVEGKSLSTNDYTTADKNIVASIANGSVTSVNGQTGSVSITPDSIGAIPNTLDVVIREQINYGDLNNIKDSGFYRAFRCNNFPNTSYGDYCNLMVLKTDGGNTIFQFTLYHSRKYINGTWKEWEELKRLYNNKKDIADLIYPVGSIYMSVNSTSPATLFGGTWERWGNGRVPVGVDASQTEFNTVGKTGGEKTNTLTTAQIPSHSHTVSSQTVSTQNDGSHQHKIKFSRDGVNTGTRQRLSSTGDGSSNDFTEESGAHSHSVTIPQHSTQNTGSGSAHNNLQPYITCYMWKRTA